MPILEVQPLEPEISASARRWVEPVFLEPAFAALAREHFRPGAQLSHILFEGMLLPALAEELLLDLELAGYRRHPLVDSVDVLQSGQAVFPALTEFLDWLASPEGAAFHAWLTGWDPPEHGSAWAQVFRLSGSSPEARNTLSLDWSGWMALYLFGQDAAPDLRVRGLDLHLGAPAAFLSRSGTIEPRMPRTLDFAERTFLILVFYAPAPDLTFSERKLLRPT